MASFIDLDSTLRDRDIYPNPFNYKLLSKQVESWFHFPRTTRAYGQNPGNMSLAFVWTVKIKVLTLPYSELLAAQPRVYVNFRCNDTTTRSIHLIQTINGVLSEATFVCPFLSIQNDELGAPTWIHYKCDFMQQNMRFLEGRDVEFAVTLSDGQPLPSGDTTVPDPPDPRQQTFATFEILPYIKNASIDHHLVDSLTVT